MVSVVAGNGLGLFNTSNAILGSAGVLGRGWTGQGNGRAYVNAASGNLVLQFQDEQLSGRGVDLFHLRTYNSQGKVDGQYTDGDKDGWRWDGERTVVFVTAADTSAGNGGTVKRIDGEGHETTYTWDAATRTYISSEGSGAHDTLRYVTASNPANNTWVWTEGSTRLEETYGNSTGTSMTGRLASRKDTSGNTVTFLFDSAGRLTTVTDTGSGQKMVLVYEGNPPKLSRIDTYQLVVDANNRIVQPPTVSGSPIKQVEYTYDNGRLGTVKTVLNPGEATATYFYTRYTYLDSSSQLITSITQNDGSTTGGVPYSVLFEYTPEGLVKKVTDANGVMTFAYNSNSTDIKFGEADDATAPVWRYTYDATTKQLMKIEAPMVNGVRDTTQFEYDTRPGYVGNLNKVTTALGSMTYEYDARGNCTLQRDAVGNTITRTFNDKNQLVTETRYRTADPDGSGTQQPSDPVTTRYVYDTATGTRLLFVISAEGRILESRYGTGTNDTGLLKTTLKYTGGLYDLSQLSATQVPSESQMNTWVGQQDKTKLQRTDYEYDFRGNLSKRTDWSATDANGAGVTNDAAATVMEFIYDGHGLLRQTIEKHGSSRDRAAILTSFGYDGMGRETQRITADGTQNTVYDDKANTVTVSAAGTHLSEIRSFDARGRLISVKRVVDDTSREMRYFYDAQGREQMMQDPAGNRRFSFYDALGRLQYLVDGTGAVTGYEYDADGHLTVETHYDDQADTSGWGADKTRLVIGTDVVADNSKDRVTRYDYDPAGRLRTRTDATGVVTTMGYDGMSNLASQQTGERTTRYFYDGEGRTVGMLDAMGYLTEYKYDAGGRLIETVRYNARSPGASNAGAPAFAAQAAVAAAPVDVLANLRPASSADDLHSYMYYDGQGRVVGSVDERGFLTETVYSGVDNTQQTLRYMNHVTAGASSTLSALRGEALEDDGIVLTSTTTLDDFGRIASVRGVDDSITRYEYDNLGRLVRTVTAADTSQQRASRIFYNDYSDVLGTVGGEGDVALATLITATHPTPTPDEIRNILAQYGVRYEYDAAGRRIKTVEAKASGVPNSDYGTLYFYDGEGRPRYTVNAKGEVSEMLYDAFGAVTTQRRYGSRLSAQLLGQLMSGTKGLSDLVTALAAFPQSKNRVTSYDYDQRGALHTATDAEGYVTTTDYNVYGEVDRQVRVVRRADQEEGTPELRSATEYDYDLNGRVISQVSDAGVSNFTTQIGYDAFGRRIRSVDGAGKVTTTVYEDSGRTIEVTDALGRMVHTEYDALDRVVLVTDALQATTRFNFDDAARTLTVTTPENITVTTTRNAHGDVVSVTDGRGIAMNYEYDKDGHLTLTTDSLNHTVRNEYEKNGLLKKITDKNGNVVKFEYDALARMFRRTVDPDGLGLVCTYQFDAFGQTISATEGKGNNLDENVTRVTTFKYNLNGRQTDIIVDEDGLGLLTTFKYDADGNTIRVERGTLSNPRQQVTSYVFDGLGRRVKEIVAPSALLGTGPANARNLTTEYRYDAAGRVSRRIDANGVSTWYVYDDAGQLRQTINAMGEVTQTNYDAAGRVVSTINNAVRLSAATVNGFGDVVAAVSVAANAKDHRSYFVYDKDGRQRFTLVNVNGGNWSIVENRLDANGNVIETRAYEKFLLEARITALDTDASPGITLEEMAGELTALGYVESTASTLAGIRRTRYAYDVNNRLRFTVDALGDVSENAYDAGGNVIKTVRYAARPTLSAFDEATINGAVNRGNDGNQVSYFAYDKAGRLRFTVRVLASSSGVPTQQLLSEQIYDSVGQVVQVNTYARALDNTATNYSEQGLAGKIVRSADDRQTAFVYDAAGRQVYTVRGFAMNSSGVPTRYAISNSVYDAMGRVVQNTVYATTNIDLDNYSLGAVEGAVTTNAQDRTTRFVYDVTGRQRFVVAADGAFKEMLYDALGQVMEIRQFDLRVGAATPMTETDLMNLRGARQVGDGVTRGEKYTYDKAGRTLTRTDALNYVETYGYDAFGDRTSMIDKAGATWTYEYDRVGRLIRQTTPPVMIQLSNEAVPSSRALVTTFEYNQLGDMFRQIEASGTVDARITLYGYDLLGRRTLLTQPGFYDPSTGRVESATATGRFQRTLQTTYDELGNVVKTSLRVAAGSAASSFINEYKVYDNLGRVRYDVDGLTNVSAFDYNAFGEQTSVTRFSVKVNAPTASNGLWNASTLATAIGTDSSARTMTAAYDNRGNKIRTTQPTVTSYYFTNTFGNYIPLDNTITAVSGAGSTTFEFNAFGELFHQSIQLDDTRRQETWHYYDVMGRETRTVVKSKTNIAPEGSPSQPGGFHTARSYDAFGNLVQVIEYVSEGRADKTGDSLTPPPAPGEANTDRITSYLYDARNQQTDTLRSNFSYTGVDGSGNYVQIDVGRSDGVTMQHTEYDGLGRTRSSTDALNNVTSYEYNALSQLIKVTEPARLVVKSGLNNPDPFLSGSQVMTSPVTDLVLNAFGQIVRSTRSPGRSDAQGATVITVTVYDFGGNAIVGADAAGGLYTVQSGDTLGGIAQTVYGDASLWTVIAQANSLSLAQNDTLPAGEVSRNYRIPNLKFRQYDFSGRISKETQATSAILGSRLSLPQQNLQIWKGVSHTLERRYAYDAVGHMTDTLDVFMDGSTRKQSGQRKLYNAFNEVTDEQFVWGNASDAVASLQHATRVHNTYDNAGNLIGRDAADGHTHYFYDLAGQVTRIEQRGNGSTADGTHTRISETVYDLMGRAVVQRAPTFSSNRGPVTPNVTLTLDRWGNVIRRIEAGTLDGFVTAIRDLSYVYNADNKLISAEQGTAPVLRSDGTAYAAAVRHLTHYDLAGHAVEQIDVAENSSNHSVATLRTRGTYYDSLGQVVEERDAEQTVRGQHGVRYAYDANGERVATLNAVGNVFIDSFDNNGNLLAHRVLRRSPGGENDTYVSGSGVTPLAVLLHSYSYDQANRLIETRDYLSTALFNASYTQYDERGLVRGTFRIQLNVASLPWTSDPGRETSSSYDILGNKIQQTDPYGNTQSWNYNIAADGNNAPNFVVGRLNSTTSTGVTITGLSVGGSHTIAYTYTDFGQLRQETYSGTDIPNPDVANNRVYSYFENGLLERTVDNQSVGTAGDAGGLDYWTSTSTNSYEYTARAQVQSVRIVTTGSYEDYVSATNRSLTTRARVGEDRLISNVYDDRGRVIEVVNWPDSDRSSGSVTYDYDEIGNRTRARFNTIARATQIDGHTVPGNVGDVITGRELWFAYDREGRMTLANKSLEHNDDGTIKNIDPGVVITYDAAGRRATTLTFQMNLGTVINDPDTGEVIQTASWDQSLLERYTYNDLGYITRIDQAGVRANKLGQHGEALPDDPGPSAFITEEMRSYDFLGNLSQSLRYDGLEFLSATDMELKPERLALTVINRYTAEGQLDTQDTIDPRLWRLNTTTKNNYVNGLLASYTFTKGDGTDTDPTHGRVNTYIYTYAFKAGAMREKGVEVRSTLADTTTTWKNNIYDARGNLVWQRTHDEPQNIEMVFLEYDGEGRVLDKSTYFTPQRFGAATDRFDAFFYDANGQAIGNTPSSSFIAARATLHANFGIAFTPVSPTYPSSQPSSYTVIGTETLADIARSYLGDAQLWYLIADANSLTFGPTESLQSQAGRTLRIPNVVTNTHNNNSTFSPYNPDTIIPSTPWVGADYSPPAPSACEQSARQIATVVGIIVSIVVGVVLSPLGPVGPAAGAAAGNLTSQLIMIGWGGKDWDDFSGTDVAEAAGVGFVAGGIGMIGAQAIGAAESVGGQLLIQAGVAAANYGLNYLMQESLDPDREHPFSIWGVAAAAAGGAVPSEISLFGQLANDALNPDTGWVWHEGVRGWDSFYQQLGLGLGQIALQQAFAKPGNWLPEPEEGSRALSSEVIDEWDALDSQQGLTLTTTSLAAGYAQDRRSWNRQLTAASLSAGELLDPETADLVSELVRARGQALDNQIAATSSSSDLALLGAPVPDRLLNGSAAREQAERQAARAAELQKLRQELTAALANKTPEEKGEYVRKNVVLDSVALVDLARKFDGVLDTRHAQAYAAAVDGNADPWAYVPETDVELLNLQAATALGTARGLSEAARIADMKGQALLRSLGNEPRDTGSIHAGHPYSLDFHQEYARDYGKFLLPALNPVGAAVGIVSGLAAEKIALAAGASEGEAALIGFGVGLVAGGLKYPRLTRALNGYVLESGGVPASLSREAPVIDVETLSEPYIGPERQLAARPDRVSSRASTPSAPGDGLPARGFLRDPDVDALAITQRADGVGGETRYINTSLGLTKVRITDKVMTFDTASDTVSKIDAVNAWLAENPGRDILLGVGHGTVQTAEVRVPTGKLSSTISDNLALLQKALEPNGLKIRGYSEVLRFSDPDRVTLVNLASKSGQLAITRALDRGTFVCLGQCFSTFSNFVREGR